MEAIKPKIGIIYDSILMEHKSRRSHPQKPQRVQAIIKGFQKYHYLNHPKIQYIDTIKRLATDQELQLAHSQKYIKHIKDLWPKTSHRIDMTILDSYLNQQTQKVSRIAVGGVLNAVDKLSKNSWDKAFAVIRPPGHHSGYRNTINGFCVYNNVAIAAKYAVEKYNYKKVLILDWDVHHGDGTQHILLSYPNTMFISIHRYDRGTFYPASQQGHFTNNGKDLGQGLHLNIPLNYVDEKYHEYSFQSPGDNQYIYIFNRIIEPVLKQYQPDFIIISSGFDAANQDPLGGFTVTPNGYYYMTKKLIDLAINIKLQTKKNVPILAVLQGGYNLSATSQSAAAVMKGLLQQQQFPQQLAYSYYELKNKCYLENILHQQVDKMIQFFSQKWKILKNESLLKYTQLIKSNKSMKFSKTTAKQSSSSDQVDDDQNQDRPKYKQQIKKQQKKQIKQKEQYDQLETNQSVTTTQFYFAAGHMQRFKNFSLNNQKIHKWAYDSQIKFYESNFQQKQFAPIYYGKEDNYIIIQNLLYQQKNPIIMDIKLSRQSKNPYADQQKKQKQKKKQIKSTSDKYSFRISGYTTPQFKQGGLLNNSQQTVKILLKKVISQNNKQMFINFLEQMSQKMKNINRKYYGTSIVLVKGQDKSMIKWVDFHYWVADAQGYDNDLVEGLDNLRKFIAEID